MTVTLTVPRTCPQAAASRGRPRPTLRVRHVDALGGPQTLPNEEVLHSVHRGNKEAACYSGFVIPKEPSDGLEPSTPSLPWRFSGGTGVHGRALTLTFLLQTAMQHVPGVPARDRACSGSRTRVVPAGRCLFSKRTTADWTRLIITPALGAVFARLPELISSSKYPSNGRQLSFPECLRLDDSDRLDNA